MPLPHQDPHNGEHQPENSEDILARDATVLVAAPQDEPAVLVRAPTASAVLSDGTAGERAPHTGETEQDGRNKPPPRSCQEVHDAHHEVSH